MGSSYSSSNYSSDQPPSPVHLYFFLLIFLMFIGLTWYINYEPVLESLFDQGKLILMASPLLLLLLVHWFSNDDHQYGRSSFPEIFQLELLELVSACFLFFLISYHSSFQERWFPLLSRS
uniref:Uncharacterized protein n=1 Tax=Salix viminalis TaxID=40686 RepID=A0A6N2KUA6_SALVM